MGVRLFSPRASEAGGEPASSRIPFGREAAALLLLAAAAYLALAVASLPSLVAGPGADRGNWVGPVGAWIAELLVAGFGAAAWLLPLELVLLAAPAFHLERPRPPLGQRLGGDLVLWILLASLLHVAFPDSLYQGRAAVGGDVGLFFGELMRALFQRKRGRDLFDLYWALTHSPTPVDPPAIIASFEHYLRQEGTKAGRAEFIRILDDHLQDWGFCSDMQPLLRTGIRYDPQAAGKYVKTHLLNLLPA